MYCVTIILTKNDKELSNLVYINYQWSDWDFTLGTHAQKIRTIVY